MSNTNQSRFWSDLAGRWQILSKNNLPETDSSIIEVKPDDMDALDEEIDEILEDLDLNI